MPSEVLIERELVHRGEPAGNAEVQHVVAIAELALHDLVDRGVIVVAEALDEGVAEECDLRGSGSDLRALHPEAVRAIAGVEAALPVVDDLVRVVPHAPVAVLGEEGGALIALTPKLLAAEEPQRCLARRQRKRHPEDDQGDASGEDDAARSRLRQGQRFPGFSSSATLTVPSTAGDST